MLLLLSFCLAFTFVDPSWPCACWLGWAWRHRRVPVPRRHNRRKATACIGDTAQRAGGGARKAHWRSKPEWACKEVLYLASHGRSCREIEARFNRVHGDHTTVGHSWVAEHIKDHAAEVAERRKVMRRRPPRFFAVAHTWALDLTFLVNAQGFTFAVLGILDHGSRRLLCLEQLP